MRHQLARWVPGLTRVRQPILRGPAKSETPQAGSDGLPLPPPALRSWVALTDDPAWFLHSGQLGALTLVDVLARQGRTLDDIGDLLDFGCGCGRVLRHLRPYESVRLHGTDCNAVAIGWWDEHLNFAEFSSNALEPPLRYRNHSFDLIYAFSVFTHLTEPLQKAWITELGRVLRPNGLLIITVNGEHYIDRDPLSQDEQARYDRGELVLRRQDIAGQNGCVAFHPQRYVCRVLAQGFEVVDYLPAGARGNPPQDAYVLRPQSP
jgi:SAM-dependent methyltransferase